MTNDETNPNEEAQGIAATLASMFVIRASSFLRHSPATPKRGEGGSFELHH
jgi:hypothetical protein